jgi:hypothetical protein
VIRPYFRSSSLIDQSQICETDSKVQKKIKKRMSTNFDQFEKGRATSFEILPPFFKKMS